MIHVIRYLICFKNTLDIKNDLLRMKSWGRNLHRHQSSRLQGRCLDDVCSARERTRDSGSPDKDNQSDNFLARDIFSSFRPTLWHNLKYSFLRFSFFLFSLSRKKATWAWIIRATWNTSVVEICKMIQTAAIPVRIRQNCRIWFSETSHRFDFR